MKTLALFVFGEFKRKDFIQKLLFLEGKANKFAARSLKTELHQINLLMLLCTLRKVIIIKLKTLR
ncbi:hypothetical protein [Chryseobacterium gambrini]|uniref:hypothetical protein n=1 Tax=Chryseobacterium gambrini TaxID=373672 RepID=UPI0011156909|nr:hypothetical protein [Chryseobacterium gambrini]